MRAAGSTVAGALLVPVGLGLGVPWAQADWTSPLAAVGLAALAAGAVLLLLGLLRIGRVVRRRWLRPLALLPVVFLVLVSSLVGTTALLAAVPAPVRVGLAQPADRGLDATEVRFPARDGTLLAGWYVPSRNGAALALLHGAHSTRTAVLPQAQVLARHGYGVLMFDARGHGRSAGQAMDFGWYGEDDLSGAVTWLLGRSDVRGGRVAAVGESMGGEEAIGALGADPRLRAVVGEGATNRVTGDWDWLTRAYGGRGTVTRWVHGLTYALTDLLTPATPPPPLAEAVRRGARGPS